MICLYGMGDAVGLVHCAQRPGMFLPLSDGNTAQVDCSPRTARDIDTEVKKLLDDAYMEAKKILGHRRDKLELVAQELIAKETIDGAAFRKLLDLGQPAETGLTG